MINVPEILGESPNQINVPRINGDASLHTNYMLLDTNMINVLRINGDASLPDILPESRSQVDMDKSNLNLQQISKEIKQISIKKTTPELRAQIKMCRLQFFSLN